MTAPKLYPHVPTYTPMKAGLTPVQHVAVRYLAGGWSVPKVAEELKLSQGLIKKWMKDNPTFRAAFEEQVVAHTELVESILLEGERRAAETLKDALQATTPKGDPNWNVRVQAAINLLDRGGQRGKAVERQQVAQLTAHVKGGADVEKALQKALRDPGVRMWLKESGAVVGLLSEGEVTAEPIQEAEVEVIDDGFESQTTEPLND